MLKYLLPLLLSCAGRIKDASHQDTAPPWQDCSNEVGFKACPISLLDQHNNKFDLYSDKHQGKSLVLDFSTVWCYWCQVAAQTVPEVQAKYANDLVYVTILVENSSGQPTTQEDIQEWADVFEITSPVLQGDDSLIDPTQPNSWSLVGFPTFYFLDSDKVIQSSLSGWSETRVEENIQLVLGN